MKWLDAVTAMRAGKTVRRRSECWTKVIDPGCPELQGEHWHDGLEHAAVHESGQEGARLMHAWTDHETPVLVFMGSSSKCLFVPDDEHRGADDWVVVGPDEQPFGEPS